MKNTILICVMAIIIHLVAPAAHAQTQSEDIKSRGFKPVTNISTDSRGVIVEALDGNAVGYNPQTIIFIKAEDEDRMHQSYQATAETQVDVSEILSDKTFMEMFTGISENLDSLVLTQPQIMMICNKYFERLAKDDTQNIFLTKIGDEYFTVVTKMGSNESLALSYFSLNYDYVWHRETQRRIFYPHQ